jgi:large subunit ribosomal protein L21
MYAVIKTGGKQYKVAAGEKLKVEQIPASIGEAVVFGEVLMVVGADAATTAIGTPLVVGAQVQATVINNGRHDKVKIFKMRRRKHYQKRQGHRQWFTEIQITSILGAGGVQIASAALGMAPVAAAVAPKATRSKKVFGQTKTGADDLEVIEGIGPKIAELCHAAGIVTFADLAAASTDKLKSILHDAGSKFAMHDPSTWAEQAALARDGKWDAFKALTDALDGGKRN